MEQKLSRSKEIKEAVDSTFEDYLKKGWIIPVAKGDEQRGHYLSHFVVSKTTRTTTKHRIVFNCAQKFAHQHTRKSLNDAILTGPKMHTDIVPVLLRFRRHKIAMAADISKMYLHFQLKPSDQLFHRFIWKGKPYQFTRWQFGNKSAPCVALTAVAYHASKCPDEAVRVALKESLYVDDFMPSSRTLAEAIALRELTELHLAKANLPLCKWVSNSKELMDTIPMDKRAAEFDISGDKDAVASALGLAWDATGDVIRLVPAELQEETLTKTTMLSMLNGTFDPLGLADPVTLEGKKAMQTINSLSKELEISWATPLEQVQDDRIKEAVKQWRNYEKQIVQLGSIAFPRQIQMSPDQDVTIHIFCDGSKQAKGVVAYLVQGGPTPSSRIIWAKKVLTSLTPRSVPRIELEAAVIGAHMAVALREVFGNAETHLWTDNIGAYYWIKKSGKQHDKVYVGHQVAEIFDMTNDC
ncbi:MAG TPA: hypothetical protein EYP93_08200, partial [Gammaproteobacteria bacterium]|nr:hypothetical protein [Gammaproteobacteria bacterium]